MALWIYATTETTLSRPADVTDISIKNVSNADISWLKKNVQQLMDN